jgi:hypothetical protein
MTKILVNGISASMFPLPCNLKLQKISLSEAKDILSKGFISAIGYESTAKILSELLGVEVQLNRINVKCQSSDVLIVFTLKSRAPEGKILTKEEIEAIGYEFVAVYVQ